MKFLRRLFGWRTLTEATFILKEGAVVGHEPEKLILSSSWYWLAGQAGKGFSGLVRIRVERRG